MGETMPVETSKRSVGFPVKYVSVEAKRDGRAPGRNEGINEPRLHRTPEEEPWPEGTCA